MIAIADLADKARDCLLKGDKAALALLMDQNFALRRHLYGDAVVGYKNIQAASVAHSLGLAAKFTGSGGAFLCLRREGQGW